MELEKILKERSANQCELCSSPNNLSIYQVPPQSNETVDNCVYICATCTTQIEDADETDTNHWRCLNDSIWSEVDAVKVVSWRMLNRLKSEGWPQNLLDMMYLEEEVLKWAASTGEGDDERETVIHKDANGAILENGDTVVLTKDLNVKGGGNFTAKRGTAVRRISLVHDNAEQIEGKVEGQQIVILTKFVKKI